PRMVAAARTRDRTDPSRERSRSLDGNPHWSRAAGHGPLESSGSVLEGNRVAFSSTCARRGSRKPTESVDQNASQYTSGPTIQGSCPASHTTWKDASGTGAAT